MCTYYFWNMVLIILKISFSFYFCKYLPALFNYALEFVSLVTTFAAFPLVRTVLFSFPTFFPLNLLLYSFSILILQNSLLYHHFYFFSLIVSPGIKFSDGSLFRIAATRHEAVTLELLHG